MQNKLKIGFIASILLCFIGFCMLVYINIKSVPFDVKHSLFILPKQTTAVSIPTKTIMKYNKDKYPITFEVQDYSVITASGKKVQGKTIATNYVYPYIYKVPIISGGFFTEEHEKNQSRVVVLNHAAAFNLFGTDECINNSIKMNGNNFKVIGVLDNGDIENNIVYYPVELSSKEPTELLISFQSASKEEVEASLNNLGLATDNYYIINMDYVHSILLDKVFICTDAMIVLIICILLRLLIKYNIKTVAIIKTILLKDLYFIQFVRKKFLMILKLTLSSSLIIGLFYYLLALANKYLEYFLNWKVDWDFIKKANSFNIMTEKLYSLREYTNLIGLFLLVTVAYTCLLYGYERYASSKK